MRLRRYTTQAAKIIRLIPTDVGRPITDIASDLVYPGLTDDAADVIRTLIFVEKVVAGNAGPILLRANLALSFGKQSD